MTRNDRLTLCGKLLWFNLILFLSIPSTAAESTYYEDLKVLCRKKSAADCCLASVATMEAGGYQTASKDATENYGCPQGYNRNMMRCVDSLQWCQPAQAGETKPAAPEYIKVYLLDEIQRELEAMSEPSPEKAALEQAWKPLLKEEGKKLKHLQTLVVQTPQEKLPKVLVSVFLEEDITEQGQFPSVDPYLIMMGESVVPLLMGSYDSVPVDMREQILKMLGAIGSGHALPVIRNALASGNVREVSAGQVALRQILGEEAAPELISLLNTSDNIQIIKTSLRQLESLDQADWCAHFLEAWQAGKLNFSDLSEIGDPQECTPKSLGEHVDLLLKILNSDAEAGEQYWVRDLIAKIDQPSAIYDLLPLLPQIVMERYRSGGVIEGFSKEAKIPSTELGFTDTQADALLREMASILDSDEIRRMQEESPPILLRLFLTDLLAKKEGKRLDLNGQIFSFRIEALDGTGLLLAASDYRLRIGEEQNIVLTSSTGGFPDHQIALKVNFDLDTFMFHFEPLLIHLRPNGAEFSLDVPVEGVNETNLLVSMRGEQVPITWRFIHVK